MFARVAALTAALIFIGLFITLLISGAAEARAPTVGSQAPPFSGGDLDGNEITLASLHGNVVILNFWATWCGPCKEEMPMLDRYLRAHQKSGVRMVAVTTDASSIKAGSLKGLQSILSFPLLKSFNGSYEPIGNAIPTTFVIDRDGIVRYAKAGALDLDALNTIVGPLLTEPPPSSSSAITVVLHRDAK